MLKLLKNISIPLFMSTALIGCGTGTTSVSGGTAVAKDTYIVVSSSELNVTAESQTSTTVTLFGDTTSGVTSSFDITLDVVNANNESAVESNILTATLSPSPCALNLTNSGTAQACSIILTSNESVISESATGSYLIKPTVTSAATGQVIHLSPIPVTTLPVTSESEVSGVLHISPMIANLSILSTYYIIVSLDNSQNISDLDVSVSDDQGDLPTSCNLSTTDRNWCFILVNPANWSIGTTATYTASATSYNNVTATYRVSGS